MELALSSLHDVHVPLLPPLLSKDDILHCLVSHQQVCDTTEDRMLLLFLLTDLVTAAAVQPHFLDMFIKDSSGQSRNKIFSKLGTQWSKIFRRINFSPKSERPDKEVMTALHSALGRCYSLLESSCPHITKLLLCHESNDCFRSYHLEPIVKGGRHVNITSFITPTKNTKSEAHEEETDVTETSNTDKRYHAMADNSGKHSTVALETFRNMDKTQDDDILTSESKTMIKVRAPEELFPSHHRFHSETNIFSLSTTCEQTSSLVKPSEDKNGQKNFVRSLKKKLEVLEHNLEANKKMKPDISYVDPVVVDMTTASRPRDPGYKERCNCDDCKYVTSPHVARMKKLNIVCRCHPCVLDRMANVC